MALRQIHTVKVFLDQSELPSLLTNLRILESTTNSTNVTEEQKDKVLRIKWYIAVVIVVGILLALYFFYRTCFHPSINKRKLHELINEARAEELM